MPSNPDRAGMRNVRRKICSFTRSEDFPLTVVCRDDRLAKRVIQSEMENKIKYNLLSYLKKYNLRIRQIKTTSRKLKIYKPC